MAGLPSAPPQSHSRRLLAPSSSKQPPSMRPGIALALLAALAAAAAPRAAAAKRAYADGAELTLWANVVGPLSNSK